MRRAGFVLVGGLSRRMGQDKARLPQGPSLLVEDVAESVRQAAGNVALVGAPERYRDLAFDRLDDLRSDCGPLGGIEAALASRRGDLNLIVACDMPGLAGIPLQNMLDEAEKSPVSCLVCRDAEGRLHPLCGVWARECLGQVSNALDQHHLRVSDLVESLYAQTFELSEPPPNINTPADWLAWRRKSLANGRFQRHTH